MTYVTHLFEKAGYATHVSSDACYAEEFQDWRGDAAEPRPPNVSDHPLLDAFCSRRRQGAAKSGAASFESRWAGALHAPSLDAGRSVCLAGETVMRRWLQHTLAFLQEPAYATTPKFAFTALHDVSCGCESGAAHVYIETEWFLKPLAYSDELAHTAVVLVSDNGLLEPPDAPPGDLHLPMLSLLVPRDVLRAAPDAAHALGRNQRRLVTPFDIHATLRDIAASSAPRGRGRSAQPQGAAVWDEFRDAFAANANANGGPPHSKPPAAGPFGQSLLLPIAEGRGCHEAGIPQSTCRLEPVASGSASISASVLKLL